MTLPVNITLPLVTPELTSKDPQILYDYMRKLVYSLSVQIQQTNQTLNGTVTTLNATNSPSYAFVQGSTTSGTATYVDPILVARRINLMVFTWFDIAWSGHTGTGNLLITLPFYAQSTIQNPFVAVIESDGMTYGAGYTYLTGNLTPNTNTIVIDQCGSGKAIIPLPISASGHLRGSITYAGKQNT
jgi:hypothetical protein